MLVFLLIGLVPILFFWKISLSSYESQALEQRISEMKYHANIISNLILNVNYFAIGDSGTTRDIASEISYVAEVYKGRILIVDRNLQILTDTYGLEENKTLISEEAVKGLRGESSTYTDKENEYI